MLGRTRRFWTGVALLFVGTVFLFGGALPGFNTPFVLLALGVLVLAAGTLIFAMDRRTRSV
ncbi:hypothetical protein [Haladaptatus sp. DFWS20]|uniref:hypothetical protein n=1 Tax=Haladaptatus sp. DFWS20 TaxID=3403467 RepID=UPI003EB7D509